MRFEWDEDKNEENIRKHGIDFEDAKAMFFGPVLVSLDDREDYGEDRWIAYGLVGHLTFRVCYTEPATETIRIISCRRASADERRHYEAYLKDRLEPG